MDWTQMLTPILQALSGVLATVITAFLVKFLKDKAGIALDVNQQKQAKEIVLGIEEKAISLIKHKYVAPSGEAKHAEAVDQLRTVSGLSKVEAVAQVDRAVGSLPNVGALKTSICDPPIVVGAP
jgi:hypothetical protein